MFCLRRFSLCNFTKCVFLTNWLARIQFIWYKHTNIWLHHSCKVFHWLHFRFTFSCIVWSCVHCPHVSLIIYCILYMVYIMLHAHTPVYVYPLLSAFFLAAAASADVAGIVSGYTIATAEFAIYIFSRCSQTHRCTVSFHFLCNIYIFFFTIQTHNKPL